MALTDNPGSYAVPVVSSTGQIVSAFIGPANKRDLPKTWGCDWHSIWKHTDFECQAIIKIVESNNLWGLMRYSLFPYPPQTFDKKPEFLYIENIEAHPARRPFEVYMFKRNRPQQLRPFINPVGKWLIWHACHTALEYCAGGNESVLTLESEPEALGYYRDTIGMTEGKGDAFNFDRDQAAAFCNLQRATYGDPQPVNAT